MSSLIATLPLEIAELSLSGVSRERFRRSLLERLQHHIGAELCSFQGPACPALTPSGSFMFSEQQLSDVFSALQPTEAASMFNARRAVDLFEVIGRRRLLKIDSTLEFFKRQRVNASLARGWTSQGRAFSILLGRCGAGPRFSDRDAAILDCITPVVMAAEHLIPAEQSGSANDVAAWMQSLRLTRQESRIADLARRGLSNSEIGALIGCSKLTVRNHLVNVYRKARVSNRSELAFTLGTTDASRRDGRDA